jgi:hypothetical protein
MELPRTLEAADIPELGGQNHGSVGLEATEAADQVPQIKSGRLCNSAPPVEVA